VTRLGLAFGLGLGLAFAACVPASEARPPAGAFGFVTEPSPATRGEPFVTSDGWTIRVETLAMQISVSAKPADGSGPYSYGRSDTYRIDASKSAEVFARELPVGAATGTLGLASNYIGDGSFRRSESTEVIGLSPELDARFEQPADGTPYETTYGSRNGPSIVLVAQGERDGRIVRLDLSLDVYSSASPSGASGEVVANGLTSASVHVAAEALFHDPGSTSLRFDDLAAADRNGDGRVSGQELVDPANSTTSCVVCGSAGSTQTTTLFEIFRKRCDGLFVP
jgi:hypothetical protein